MENIKINKQKMPLKRKLFILSIVTIPLLSFLFFYVYINFNSFLLAFQEVDKLGEHYTFVGFKNFKEFLTGVGTTAVARNSLKNSVMQWWITFLICTPLYVIFAYYISKKMPGNALVYTLVMLPSVVSAFVYALSYKKFVEVGLMDIMGMLGYEDFPQLISDWDYAMGNNLFFCIWMSFGSSTLIFVNAINGVDKEVLESAMIDGANDRVQFFKIVLPMIWPTFSTYCITGTTSMFTWSGHLMTFYMYGADESIWGLGYYFTVTIKNNVTTGFSQYPMVATAGLCVTIMSIPITFGTKWLMNKLDRMSD